MCRAMYFPQFNPITSQYRYITLEKMILLCIIVLTMNLLESVVNHHDSTFCSISPAISDSLLAIDPLSGAIYYTENYSDVIVQRSESESFIGDYYDWIMFDHATGVGYLSFLLPQLPDGYALSAAELSVFCFGWRGNSVINQYPIFELPGRTITPQCILEHIDYGLTFGTEDVTPEQIFGQTVLFDSDMTTFSWKTIDVTESLQNDINLGRTVTQFRIYLDGFADWDNWDDYFGTTMDSNVYNTHAPRIKYVLTDGTPNNDPEQDEVQLRLTAYPNPMTLRTKIIFKPHTLGSKLIKIYNLKGQLVRSLPQIASVKGEQIVDWDGANSDGKSVESGIYIILYEDGGRRSSCRVVVVH